MTTSSRSPFPAAWLPQGPWAGWALQAPGCHGGHRPRPLGVTRRARRRGLLPQRMAAGTMHRPRLTAPFVSPPGGRHKTKCPVSAARGGTAWHPARGTVAGPCCRDGTRSAQPEGAQGGPGGPLLQAALHHSGGKLGLAGEFALAGCCHVRHRSLGAVGGTGMGMGLAKLGG